MGLGGQAVDAIGREHAYRPITGDVLFIGRQTTYFTPQDLAMRLRDHCQRSMWARSRSTAPAQPQRGRRARDRPLDLSRAW
jgi:hypothetical protein